MLILTLQFPSTLGAFPVMLIKCFSFYFCQLARWLLNQSKQDTVQGKWRCKDLTPSRQLTYMEMNLLKTDIDPPLE